MTPDPDPTTGTEARLRRALAARADSVEPRTGTELVPALSTRADAARRRANQQRALLSVAAATVVVAGIALGLALAGGDRDDLDVAGTTSSLDTTTTTVGALLPADPVFDSPVIWPLPTMSIVYTSPESAASAFWTGYLGRGIEDCLEPAQVDGARAVAGICGVEGQEVFVRDDGARGWVVVGAESEVFDLDSPEAGSTHAGQLPIGLSSPVPVELVLRPIGSVNVVAVEEVAAGDVDAGLAPADAVPGTYVLAVSTIDDQGAPAVGASVRAVNLTEAAPTTTSTAPTTTSTSAPTTTTTLPPDDGRQGWPADQRRFDAAGDAAIAFATDVLGFADATAVDSSGTAPDVTVDITSRPTAGATTTVAVHDTGARGWVVVDATSDQGRIDEVEGRTVRGVAAAFEGNLVVRLLALDGTVLDETTTQAGSNGEQAPFEAELGVDRPAGPHFVLIGDADQSGFGDLNWAAVTLLGA